MIEKVRKRWPSKPRQGERCDAMIGTTTDITGAPTLIRCPNEATETCLGMMETWLCSDCAEVLEVKGYVRRNPRRKA